MNAGQNCQIGKEDCPITQGRPTSYDKAVFETLCKQKQSEKVGGVIFNPQCQVCLGKTYPEELTVVGGGKLSVKNNKEKRSSRKNLHGVCELCDAKDKSLRRANDIDVCSSCQIVIMSSKLRPKAVIKALSFFNHNTDLPSSLSNKDSIKKIADQAITIESLSEKLEAAKIEVDQLKKELIAEKVNAEQAQTSSCPLTKGKPTSTTKAPFDDLCADTRQGNNVSAQCLTCCGNFYPRELTFIEERKVAQFFKGESNQTTIIEALRISETNASQVEEENRKLKSENANLELKAANAIDEARAKEEELQRLKEAGNNNIDKEQLLILAMDLAEGSIEKRIKVTPECFRALRSAATNA